MKKKGFTLIELIISIVVIALVVTSLAMVYRQIIKALTYNTELNKANQLQQLIISQANNFHYENPDIMAPQELSATNYLNTGFDINIQISYIVGDDTSLYSAKTFRLRVFKTGESQAITDTTFYRLRKLKYVTF